MSTLLASTDVAPPPSPAAPPPAPTRLAPSEPTAGSVGPGSLAPASSALRSPVHAVIAPWVDLVVDERGFDPRSDYVERFWLGTLGPSACWLLRRLVAGFDEYPDGYVLDLEVTAAALGLGHRRSATSPFTRAFGRCVMFGLAQPRPDGYLVRRLVPEVPRRHLLRLPQPIRDEHDRWLAAHASP